MSEQIELFVNDREHFISVDAGDMLIDVLRDRLGLKGAKIGCDRGVCGACTILINGDPTAACSTFAWRADGARIVTIEGLAGEDGALDVIVEQLDVALGGFNVASFLFRHGASPSGRARL